MILDMSSAITHLLPLEAERRTGDGMARSLPLEIPAGGSLHPPPPGARGEQRNANRGTHRLKSSRFKDDAAPTIQAVEGSGAVHLRRIRPTLRTAAAAEAIERQ